MFSRFRSQARSAKTTAQLERAASVGRVLLTFNRRHFRRHHAMWTEAGRVHSGIVTLPQGGTAQRRAIRAAMLLDWLGAAGLAARFVAWIDLQKRLHAGERIEGYTEREMRQALGLDQPLPKRLGRLPLT